MAIYKITAQYDYEGVIEADSPEEAETLFLAELNDYYAGVNSYDCDEVCAECNEELDYCVCEDEEADNE